MATDTTTTGPAMDAGPVRACKTCKEVKPLDGFAKQRRDCRKCRSAYHKAWTKKQPNYSQREFIRLRHHMWRRNGIDCDWERYNAMFAAQGGLCAICKQPETRRRLSVDHDHATGKVRALLCTSCNTAIGLLNEDHARFAAASAYLREHGK